MFFFFKLKRQNFTVLDCFWLNVLFPSYLWVVHQLFLAPFQVFSIKFLFSSTFVHGQHLLLFMFPTACNVPVAGQEAYQMLPLHDHPSHLLPTTSPVAVPVTVKELPAVASSVLQAETWLRARVLGFFPSTNITTIVVGSQVLCNKKHSQQWPLVLPALKNLYHSLLRWGLHREIRLSPAFSGDRTSSPPETLPLEPLLAFIHSYGGSYSIITSFFPCKRFKLGLCSWWFHEKTRIFPTTTHQCPHLLTTHKAKALLFGF